MAFSGGTYTLPAGNPVVTGTTIDTSWANTTLLDIATALSTCMLKDGTQTITANIPMGGFKFTGLAAGTSANDSVRMAQLQGNAASYLTGTAGTNTVTANGSPVVASLATGQRFVFIPANTNTAATTLQIDSTAALSIFWNNVALTGGELRQNVPVEVLYDGTQYQLISSGAHANTFAMPDTLRIQAAGDRTKQLAVSLTGISTATTRTLTMPDSNVNLAGLTGTQSANTFYAGPTTGVAALPAFRVMVAADLPMTPITASLTADVSLNNTGLYFTGPTIAQGTAGTWWVSGTVTVVDGAGSAEFFAKLWDGTTVVASGRTTSTAANTQVTLALSGYITNPAGNLRISVKDISNTGAIAFNGSGNSKDSTISAIRVA